MRVLSVTWYKVLPPLFGGQKGIALFNEALAKQVPLVCLCSSDNDPADVPYKVLPLLPVGKSQFINPSAWNTIIETIRREEITHLILEHPYYGLAGVRAGKKTGVKLIVHSHNIESQRFRLQGRKGWRLLQFYEKWVHQKANLNLFKTKKDLETATNWFHLKSDNGLIVPYGIRNENCVSRVDCQNMLRHKHGLSPNETILLFAGTLDYGPNAEAVKRIFTEIAPKLSASQRSFRIIICGRNRSAKFQYLNELKHPAVINAGEVEDIGLYFRAADAFIDPVISGGGVQTKIFDAVAHGCSVVCFDKMLHGVPGYLVGIKVFPVANGDWNLFTALTEKVSSLQKETPPLFFAEYDWDAIAATVAERIRQL